jgi:hypothetical protein
VCCNLYLQSGICRPGLCPSAAPLSDACCNLYLQSEICRPVLSPAAPLSAACCNLYLQSGICRPVLSPAAPLSAACCNLYLQSGICRLPPLALRCGDRDHFESNFSRVGLAALQPPSPPRAAICICNLGSADGPGPWVFCRFSFRISLTKTAKAGPLHTAFAVCNLQSDRRALQLSSGTQAAICICNLQAAGAPAL